MTIAHEQIQIIKNQVNARIVNDILGGYEGSACNDVHLRAKTYGLIKTIVIISVLMQGQTHWH